MRRRFSLFLACWLLFPIFPVQATQADASSPRIALTFDDGPSGLYTPQILDILDKYNAKATFFVIGVNVEKHPDILRRIIDEGHEVGNHTYSHRHLQRMDQETLAAELTKADALLREIAGYEASLFRPPEGVVTDAVKAAAQSGGYSLVLWTIDTRDWALNNTDNIIRMIDEKASDGDIILFHDYVVGKSPTPAALDIIIPRLQNRGFEFVTVSDLQK